MENRQWPLPGQRVRQEGQSQVNDPAVNEAFEALGATYKFYKEVFDRDSIDGQGMRLDASVHFGADFMNAFWNGAQMVFGDGDGQRFLRFTKSLDVVAHELAHGGTERTAGLDYHSQPGALNESFSDVFGSLVKQYANNQTVDGNDILGPAVHGRALRSMKDPGSAYDDPVLGRDPQPKDMSGYKELPDTVAGDNGGVHINSGIPNHAFFLVATRLGGNAWTRAGKIWYDTLLALNRNSDFAECAATSIAIAGRDFGTNSEECRAVREAWVQVGVIEETVAGRIARGAPSDRYARERPRPSLDGGDKIETELKHLAAVINEVAERFGAARL